MKSVGIDFGSYSIKVVELESNKKGFQVVKYDEHIIKQKGTQDSDLDIIDFLRSLSSQYDQASTRFIVAVPQDKIITRTKIFPFNERIKILKSLPFELEDEIPFDTDASILDGKIVQTIGGQAEVLACATSKNQITQIMQKLSDCFIDPYIISSEGSAFANLYENWDTPPPASPEAPLALDEAKPTTRHLNVVLNIGHTKTLVCVFENQRLLNVRTTLWGAKNISNAIAKKYQLPPTEALKELQNKAQILVNKDGAQFEKVSFSDCITNAFHDFSKDFRLILANIKSEFNAEIDAIGISGGVSGIKNIGAYLTTQVDIACNVQTSNNHLINFEYPQNSEFESKFGLALGLAIEGFKKPRNPAINFLKGEFAKQNHYVKHLWQKWGSLAKVASAALVVLFFYSSLRDTYSLELSEKVNESLKTQAKTVAKLSGKNASLSGVKKYIMEQKKKASELRSLSSVLKMNSALDIFKKVNDAIPDKSAVALDVKKLIVQDSDVTIEGFVNTQEQVGLLKSTLTNIAIGSKIQTPTTSLSKPGKIAFSFQFKVDRGIQKVTQ